MMRSLVAIMPRENGRGGGDDRWQKNNSLIGGEMHLASLLALTPTAFHIHTHTHHLETNSFCIITGHSSEACRRAPPKHFALGPHLFQAYSSRPRSRPSILLRLLSFFYAQNNALISTTSLAPTPVSAATLALMSQGGPDL